MKKILSIVAIVLLAVSVTFTACRNDAGTQSKTEEATAPATDETTAPAEETPAATSETADTTQQQAQ